MGASALPCGDMEKLFAAISGVTVTSPTGVKGPYLDKRVELWRISCVDPNTEIKSLM